MNCQFQFHKGTIRTLEKGTTTLCYLNFNSIKVRLELRGGLQYVVNMKSFQFHKGTIRTNIKLKPETAASLFQFHKGTIRTLEGVKLSSVTFEFQFHKGTIRTNHAGR